MSAQWDAVHARPLECPGGSRVGHCAGGRGLELMPGALAHRHRHTAAYRQAS
jgi:hypothetical protein